MMRVLLLAPHPDEPSGIADYARHFSSALRARGVNIASVGMNADLGQQGIEHCLNGIDWQQVDLVHGELGGGRVGEFQALRQIRERFPGLPITATVHDPSRLVWRGLATPRWTAALNRLPPLLQQLAGLACDPWVLAQERALAKRLSRMVTLTHLGAESLRKRLRLQSPDLVTCIPHGNLRISPVGLPDPGHLRLLYFGFIHRGKGIEDLIEALALVRKQHPNLANLLSLTLAGGTAAKMTFATGGGYLDSLHRLVRDRSLEDLVHWQCDLPDEDIPALIQAHHVMVLPYRESRKLRLLGVQRGTSGALSWAAACGRGAITSDARAFAEEVASGNGQVYPQGDTVALAKCLSQLIGEPDRVTRWASVAGEIGRQRDWISTAERFERLFLDVLQRTTS